MSTIRTASCCTITSNWAARPDAPQLAPAIDRITECTGRVPRTVTADRGHREAGVDQQLTDRGVTNVVIPRKGKPSAARKAVEQRTPFRRSLTWRTGCAGRISKRGYWWDRPCLDSLGARTWTGHGMLAHNLVKIAALTA